jgi:hypothetical protein
MLAYQRDQGGRVPGPRVAFALASGPHHEQPVLAPAARHHLDQTGTPVQGPRPERGLLVVGVPGAADCSVAAHHVG